MVRGRERGKKGKKWAAAGGECILGICSRRRPLSFFAATPHHSAANGGGTSNNTGGIFVERNLLPIFVQPFMTDNY